MFKKFSREELIKKLPKPFNTIMVTLSKSDSEEERTNYLKSLPEETLKPLFKASVYTLLKLEEKMKGTLEKFNISSDILLLVGNIKQNITEKGEKIKKETVDKAVDVMWNTIHITMVVAVISLLLVVLFSPLAGVAIVAGPLFFHFLGDVALETVMFAPDLLFDLIPGKKNKK